MLLELIYLDIALFCVLSRFQAFYALSVCMPVFRYVLRCMVLFVLCFACVVLCQGLQ